MLNTTIIRTCAFWFAEEYDDMDSSTDGQFDAEPD